MECPTRPHQDLMRRPEHRRMYGGAVGSCAPRCEHQGDRVHVRPALRRCSILHGSTAEDDHGIATSSAAPGRSEDSIVYQEHERNSPDSWKPCNDVGVADLRVTARVAAETHCREARFTARHHQHAEASGDVTAYLADSWRARFGCMWPCYIDNCEACSNDLTGPV